MAADVVRLPCENTGDVGITGDGGEENAEVADAVVMCKTEKW